MLNSGLIQRSSARTVTAPTFFDTDYLGDAPYQSIAEFVQALGEHFAKEMGYEAPALGSQLRMF